MTFQLIVKFISNSNINFTSALLITTLKTQIQLNSHVGSYVLLNKTTYEL